MDVVELLFLYIESRGMLLSKTADKAGISRPRFYRMANGTVDMSVRDYMKICEALEVEPTLFMKKK